MRGVRARIGYHLARPALIENATERRKCRLALSVPLGILSSNWVVVPLFAERIGELSTSSPFA